MKDLDVLLINPPLEDYGKKRVFAFSQPELQLVPPLGLCYIAAVLENKDYNVGILDMHALRTPISQFRSCLQKLNPKIVGFRTNSVLIHFCLQMAQVVKEWNPEVKVIFGCIHATLFPVKMMESGVVDAVVREDGEYTMLELVDHYLKSGLPFPQIHGIHYKEHNVIKSTPDRPMEKSLDRFPFPARHLLLGGANNAYFSILARDHPITSMIYSRGCPFHCTFCSTTNHSFRMRSKENVLEEIRSLTENAKYPVRHIDFRDQCFSINHNYCISLCKSIEQGKFNFEWRAIFRPDQMNAPIFSALQKAGCFVAMIGSESGSDRILRFLNKGYTTHQIETAFKLARDFHIEVNTVFMMGIPGETTRDLELTRKFIHKVRPDYLQIQLYAPLPGSELYDLLGKKGIYSIKGPMPNLKNFQVPIVNLRNLPKRALKNYMQLSILSYYASAPFWVQMGKTLLNDPMRFPLNIQYMLRHHFAQSVK